MSTSLFSLTLSLTMFASAAPEQALPIDIGSRRELFVDHHLIDRLENTCLRLHEPHREGTALKFDKPWEGMFSAYITVFKDTDRYRMYYRGHPEASGDGSSNEVTCYAESEDGIEWTKPPLGLFEIEGSDQNNVVLADAAPFNHNFSPFRDTRPGVSEPEQYKALAGIGRTGLVAFHSPDGIHWEKMREEPVITEGAFDSQNVAFWSEAERCYVCYFRTWKQVDGGNYRWISRTTSEDFLEWTDPVEMSFGDTPPEHLYTNATEPYFRAPHIYIALPKRFFPQRVALPPEEAEVLVANPSYRIASSDSVFMTTRGNDRYDRTFMEAFIRPGPSPKDWIARDNTPALGVVPANEREMFIYRLSHYAQTSCHLARYSLRLDGFISAHAPYEGGELLTKPLQFSGDRLEINFATSAAGGVQVEIQDAGGNPIAGYTLEECPENIGDEIARTVRWKSGSEVSALAGTPVRLRFVMHDADLYSFKFHE